MFGKKKCQVLIVGAGPVGLFAALRLVQAGVGVSVVDKHRRTGVHSYALALHPRSLRLLDRAGLAQRLLEIGRRIETIGFYVNGSRKGELSLGQLPGDYPFALVLPQSALELELEEALGLEKLRVQWNHRLDRLRAGGERLVASVSKLDQVTSGYPIARVDWTVSGTDDIEPRFVIGADGYQSRVRKELEIDFRAISDLETFSIYEYEPQVDPGHEMRVFFDENGAGVFWPMTANRCRVSFQVAEPEQHRPGHEALNDLIRTRTPWAPEAVGEVHWSSPCQFDRRLASNMGRGRVWLAGDAVHLTSPIAAQSMNCGLVDAFEMAEMMTEMLRVETTPNLLASYERQRMRELRELIATEGRIVASGSASWVTEIGPRFLSSLPASGEDLGALLRQCGVAIEERDTRSESI